jgi:hypothetical protein
MDLRGQLHALILVLWMGSSVDLSRCVSSPCLYEKLAVVDSIAELLPWFLFIGQILPFIGILML